MIAAVMNERNEVDLAPCTVRHLLAQGVDHVWVFDWQSDDGTAELLREIDNVTVIDGYPKPFYWIQQGEYADELARIAGEAGADWIVVVDADEYWTGTNGRTIKEALEDVPDSFNTVHAEILQYADFDHRCLHPYPWMKVAFRWAPGITIATGNHGVNGGGLRVVQEDVLLVHELKFQSYEHYKFKMFMKTQVPWSSESWLRNDNCDGADKGMTGGPLSDDTPEEVSRAYWDWIWSNVEDTPIPSEYRP